MPVMIPTGDSSLFLGFDVEFLRGLELHSRGYIERYWKLSALTIQHWAAPCRAAIAARFEGGMIMKKWIPIIATTLIFAACSKNETGAPMPETQAGPATDTSAVSTAGGATAASAAETTYPMYGVLVSRDAAKNTINIDNEEVRGKMAAMKMDYEVRDAKVDTLPPDGTKLQMTVHDQNGTYWLTEVKPRQ